MFQTAAPIFPIDDKAAHYQELLLRLGGLLEGERDRIANAANMSALLFEMLPDLNWVGCYFLNSAGDELVVGPFQGRPACVRIAVGRGVCGAAVAERRSIIVPDVDAFPGHIACDAASRSELVIPLMLGDNILGVLDLDSPLRARFDDADQRGLKAVAERFVGASDW
jgi:L-methionine (R)-S-oxide reductase